MSKNGVNCTIQIYTYIVLRKMHKAIEISLITYESYLKPFQMQTWPSQPVEATKPGVPHKLQSAPKKILYVP